MTLSVFYSLAYLLNHIPKSFTYRDILIKRLNCFISYIFTYNLSLIPENFTPTDLSL